MEFIDILEIRLSSASRPIILSKISPFLICGWERFSVRIRFAFLIRFDFPSTCPTSESPLGVISLSLLTTYSIFRIIDFTLRVLFAQRFLCFYLPLLRCFVQMAMAQFCGFRYILHSTHSHNPCCEYSSTTASNNSHRSSSIYE